MPGFTDNFNRATLEDGGNWSSNNSALHIDANHLHSTTLSWGLCLAAVTAGPHDAAVTMDYGGAAAQLGAPVVKQSANFGDGYYAIFTGTAPNLTARIRYCSNNADLVTEAYTGALGTGAVIRLVYNAGWLTMLLDGVTVAEVFDDTLDANTYMGVRNNAGNSAIMGFSANADAVQALVVAPSYVQRGTGSKLMSLSEIAAGWTVGTPGSPTFEVSAGTIESQIVHTVATASIWWTPPDEDGTVTFTDPVSGATDTVEVGTTETQPPASGGECKLTDDGAELVNDTAEEFLPGHILTDAHIVILSPVMNVQDALAYLITLVRNLYPDAPPWDPGEVERDPRLDLIWNAINGGVEQPVGLWSPTTDQPVKLDTEESLAKLAALTTQYTDLADVVGILGGEPTVYSNADLKIAIDNIDLSTITDKLDSIQGSELISITDLAGQLQLIRTIAGYSLGDVLAAIQALNPATAPGLAAALATIMGSLGGLALEIAAIGAAETEDAAASSAGAVSAAGALAWLLANGPVILDMLHDVQELLASSGNAAPHPPVWPGLANVDLGAAVDLATTNTLAGPMHGVLLDITSADPGTNRYVYDTVPAWKNIGALSFFTDTGHHETYQALSFAQALYVPKAMAVAGGVRVFHGRGPQGTIRPWSYKT